MTYDSNELSIKPVQEEDSASIWVGSSSVRVGFLSSFV